MNAPLTEIAAVLVRDAALWQRGLMSTPKAVHMVMAANVLLADRLAALQVGRTCFLDACGCVWEVFRRWWWTGRLHGAHGSSIGVGLGAGGAAQRHEPEREERQQLGRPDAHAARARGEIAPRRARGDNSHTVPLRAVRPASLVVLLGAPCHC